ncbi:MAG TPA: SpoIID/LytB domain-containing protein [Gemmatimonadaceae bacterium]|nr:SpoIID/LytB domain-containing protein [Gemmatimonadaceae bacterium]
MPPVRRRVRQAALAGVLLLAGACVGGRPGPGSPVSPSRGGGHIVRIALATSASRVVLSATGDWQLENEGGARMRLRASDAWPISRDGSFLYAAGSGGDRDASRASAFTARGASDGAFITVNGKRYRGEIRVTPTDKGLLVVNRVPVEDYLRGVVPLEIGERRSDERAAVEAQAVAARSYAYSHMTDTASRSYDMVSTVMDQAYGGVSAETRSTDAAVAETGGIVLTYNGRIINAPYHSSCGGTTAAPSEVWSGGHDEPYLVPVSDRIPGTNRYYCDISPTFRWTRTYDGKQLSTVLEQYLRAYVTVSGSVGAVRQVKIDGTTPSGRVRSLTITTDRGTYTLHGGEIRFVLRSLDGDVLRSTSFTVKSDRASDGHLARLTLNGTGNGHGIGMCQWGAIGRARAGQDYQTILHTYYPGTVLARVD